MSGDGYVIEQSSPVGHFRHWQCGGIVG